MTDPIQIHPSLSRKMQAATHHFLAGSNHSLDGVLNLQRLLPPIPLPAASPQPKPDPWQKTWRFDQKGPYDLNVPAWDAHLMNEPIWLYTPPSYSSYSKAAEDPMKGFHLLRDMKREVQNCLGNPACTDTTERLIHKALQSRPELKDPTVLHGDLKRAAQEAAAGFSDPQGELLFNLFKTSELGRWAHPLREELKYAASHVKDRCTTASSESTLRRAVLKILMYLHVPYIPRPLMLLSKISHSASSPYI